MVAAIDCEAVATDASPQRLVSVAIAHRSVGVHLYAAHDPKLFDVVCWALEQGATFAFAPGDLFMLLRWRPDLRPHIERAIDSCKIFDVCTREKRIDIAEIGSTFRRGGYDLGSLAYRRAGIVLDKNDWWRLNYGLLLGLEIWQWPEAARRYALLDAVATLAVHEQQDAFNASCSANVFSSEIAEVASHVPLYQQQLIGIDTDPVWVAQLEKDLDHEILRLQHLCLQHGLARIGGTKANPKVQRSKQAAADVMAATGKARTTEKGFVALSASAMKEAMLPPDHPLRMYADLGSLQSARTRVMTPLRNPKVHTKYDECVATRRTSSSEPDTGDGTNLQNFSRPPNKPGVSRVKDLMGRFRGALVPPPGYVFGISDFGGAELCTFADTEIAWFGSSKLGEALIAKRKPHVIFACDVLSIEENQFDKTNPAHKDAYQIAKIWNFGKLGGMGDPKFQINIHEKNDLKLDLHVVREFTRLWKRRWDPQRYFDYISSQKSPIDYKIRITEPRSGFIRGGMSYTEACNFPFQSKAAYGAKIALWNLWKATGNQNSPLYGTWSCLFVHDEIVSCFPINVAEAALAEQSRIMIDSFALACPAVPVGVDSHLVERYCKL